MKIMTFNIQHCYNNLLQQIDYKMLSSEIKNVDPDILGINEIFVGDETTFYGNQLKKIADLTGYKYFYFAKAIEHEKGPYGNALLSKIPIISANTIVIPSPKIKKFPGGYYETRCLLVAEFADGKRVIVTHFGLNKDEKEQEIQVLIRYLKENKCILMGDLNSTYENPILNAIKEKMNDVAEGYCQNIMTWPSTDPKIKIDYIFVSHDIKVKNAYILEKIISDHFAHVALIDE